MSSDPIDAGIKAYIDERVSTFVPDAGDQDLDARFNYIFDLLIQQRQATIESRILGKLQDVQFGAIAQESKVEARGAFRALRDESKWFHQAFGSGGGTTALVFQTWLEAIRAKLDIFGLASLIEPGDELPPPPFPLGSG